MCSITGGNIHTHDDIIEYKNLLCRQDIRGQDFFGICILRQRQFAIQKFVGGATQNIQKIQLQVGDTIIAQNRMAFFGLDLDNTQPLVGNGYALVINGNLINHDKLFIEHNLKRVLSVDSEVIVSLIDKAIQEYQYTIDTALEYAIGLVKGVYSLLLLTQHGDIIMRQNLMPIYKHKYFYCSVLT